MKKLLKIGVILLVIVVGGLAYLGVVPGISPLLAKPVDLGVVVDPGLVTAFNIEHGMIDEIPGGVIPEDREPIYSGEVSLDVEMTSEQVTAVVDYWRKQYPKVPIRDVQIRFDENGTAEASGILEIATATKFAKQLGYSESDIEKAKSYAKYVSGDLPFYLKAKAEVQNNNVSLQASTIQIGRVTLPESISQPLSEVVADVIERRMSEVPGLDVESMSHAKGYLELVAKAPRSIR